jgi:hypothetical protein
MSVHTIAIKNTLGTLRNILAGISISYAVEDNRYMDIPVILIFPSIYSGYHLYKNREAVTVWLRKKWSKPATFW